MSGQIVQAEIHTFIISILCFKFCVTSAARFQLSAPDAAWEIPMRLLPVSGGLIRPPPRDENEDLAVASARDGLSLPLKLLAGRDKESKFSLPSLPGLAGPLAKLLSLLYSGWAL
jgi:hypothetical protein